MKIEKYNVCLRNPEKISGIKRSAGFNLIELMMVVLIIGIVTSVAIPSYRDSVLASKRSDGQTLLLNISARMEKIMYSNGAYTADLLDIGFPSASAVLSSEKYYKASVLSPTASCPIASCYIVRATPQDGQIKDGIMEVLSTGIKRRDKNNNGSATDAGEETW